jgi:LuxR family transcriptional regulator
MSVETELTRHLERLQGVATGGFAIGLHIRFATPSYMFQSYPKAWLDLYSREGLLMRDPAVAWAFAQEGKVRWADLEPEDSARVFERAREYGLVHGMTLSLVREGSRSIGGFARRDRFFDPEEIDALEDGLGVIHDMTHGGQPLPESVRAGLRRLSVAFTHP